MFVVFDMDGTLSLPEHRVHHLANKDWDSFYEACHKDPKNKIVFDLFRRHLMLADRVEIWTGRRESTREKTMAWLDAHLKGRFVLPPDNLKMRSDGDRRHDVKVKGEWLAKCNEPPCLVYEDRNSMVEFYRNQNITCLQVAAGNF